MKKRLRGELAEFLEVHTHSLKSNIDEDSKEKSMENWRKRNNMVIEETKKALEALPQVDEAVVSHETGTAELTLNAEIADDVLKKTVEDKDYTVTSVE